MHGADSDCFLFGLALANRSAALLRLGRFAEALEDVVMAEDAGHPHPDKLHERKQWKVNILYS